MLSRKSRANPAENLPTNLTAVTERTKSKVVVSNINPPCCIIVAWSCFKIPFETKEAKMVGVNKVEPTCKTVKIIIVKIVPRYRLICSKIFFIDSYPLLLKLFVSE